MLTATVSRRQPIPRTSGANNKLAFDDQTSTFIIPSGAGFNIIFCPGGRSSNILSAESHNVSSASDGEVSFGGSGNGDNADNVVARDCHDMPANNHMGSCQPGFYELGAEEGGLVRLDELRKRDEYDWTGVEEPDEPILGTRVLDLVKRGMHLIDWEGKRKRELEAHKTPGMIMSFLRMRSSASAVAAPGEVKSTTWYLMGGGLFVTAAVFMML
jgi:hypothetical protein